MDVGKECVSESDGPPAQGQPIYHMIQRLAKHGILKLVTLSGQNEGLSIDL